MTKPATHRTCNVCSIEKPVAEFPLRSSRCFLCVKGRTPRTRTHRVCHTCKIDKLASEYNGTATKCRLCVESGVKGNGDFKSGPKGKGIIKCARCGEMKPHRAKGFCDGCWQADRLEKLNTDPNYVQLVEHKICQRCNVDKLASEFPKNSKTKDRLQAWCKECVADEYRKNKEDPAWVEKNAARLRKHYSDLPQERKDKRSKNNYEREKERLRIDPEYKRRKNRQAARKNQNRDALRWEMEEHYTLEEWEVLCEKYEYKCLRCKEKKELTVDHVIPVTMEGSTDAIGNIQPLCRSCNSKKNNKFIDYRPQA